MKRIVCIIFLFVSNNGLAQDANMDYSEVSNASKSLIHLLPLMTIHGVPQNQNEDDTLVILINHGYITGFSKKLNQPRWVAYQVSRIKEGVDYERFPFFVDDFRLPSEHQIGTEGFGGGYDRGHLAPNAAINKQYGKLSQMESFLMSNISPQKGNLNRGVWQKLEAEIRDKYCNTDNDRKHIWVIVGAIFPENLNHLSRKNGTMVAIPDAFYCIIARPHKYPHESPGNAEYIAFVFPQNLPLNQAIDMRFLVSINEIEAKTGLNFFPDFTKHYEKKIETDPVITLW